MSFIFLKLKIRRGEDLCLHLLNIITYARHCSIILCYLLIDLLIFFAAIQVIMATNRADTLDPALLRPGRLDRKIEFPLPDRRQKRLVFATITAKMNLSDEVDLEDLVARPDKISGADINAICQEAGMHAVRENRYIVLAKDFEKGYKNNIKKDETEHEFYK